MKDLVVMTAAVASGKFFIPVKDLASWVPYGEVSELTVEWLDSHRFVDVPAWLKVSLALTCACRELGVYPGLAEGLVLEDRFKRLVKPVGDGSGLDEFVGFWCRSVNEDLTGADFSCLLGVLEDLVDPSLGWLSEREFDFVYWRFVVPLKVRVSGLRFLRKGESLTGRACLDDVRERVNRLVRELAVGMVRVGCLGRAEVARLLGVHAGTVGSWCG